MEILNNPNELTPTEKGSRDFRILNENIFKERVDSSEDSGVLHAAYCSLTMTDSSWLY